jgi:hypothetical protein
MDAMLLTQQFTALDQMALKAGLLISFILYGVCVWLLFRKISPARGDTLVFRPT